MFSRKTKETIEPLKMKRQGCHRNECWVLKAFKIKTERLTLLIIEANLHS